MAAILGLIAGVVAGIFFQPNIPIWLQPYLPIMVVAALDALLGRPGHILSAISAIGFLSFLLLLMS